MKSSIEDFGTGWYGLSLGLDDDDIDKLIEFLQKLKSDGSYHFHMFSTEFDSEPGGVADIQFTKKTDNEESNMDIGA